MTYHPGAGPRGAGAFDRCFYSNTADVTRAGVVAGLSLFPPGIGSLTLPANYWFVGHALRYRLAGYYSADAAPGNATILLKLGAASLRTTPSFALDNNVVNGFWQLEGAFECYVAGIGGSCQGGLTWMHAESGGGGTLALHSEPFTTVAPFAVNTTIAAAFDVLWTATDAGTSITTATARLWEIC